MQNLNRMQAERAKKAPYCITMLLTPDYGERAKGKPEAPKAQTPHHCTSRSCASSSETAARGYKIPHPTTEGPRTREPRAIRGWGGIGHIAQIPDPNPDGPVLRRGPPTIRILKPNRPINSHFFSVAVTSRCRAATGDLPVRILSAE